IRNQCSWIHSNDYEGATTKARSLVHMAVARACQLEPLKTSTVPVNHSALIIGGGAAGMTAALTLADQGFPVHIVEREDKLGGNLHQLRYFVPSNGDNDVISPREFLADIVLKVEQHPQIEIHLNTELAETGGFKGNFTSTLRQDAKSFQVQHGAIIVATGGVEYKGKEYNYGQNSNIVTQLEFENILASTSAADQLPQSVVMIQCVGPAEKYCSRLCCTTALKNALKLKERVPEAQVTILYRDIRTYGFKERIYTEARRAGVRFINFDFDHKPDVTLIESERLESQLVVRVHEPILGRDIGLNPDMLVLSNPIIPPQGAEELATKLKLPLDMDGFFLEAHVKLRPVDFSADGVFMAGMAHYPKFLDETIAQAQAAASRAARILSQETMVTNARVAMVDPQLCVGCLTCVRVCPYHVPIVSSEYTGVGEIVGAAFIESAICHGCGSCASECPAKAIQLMHYTDAQTLIKVDALFNQAILWPASKDVEESDSAGVDLTNQPNVQTE
ncbi:MAG: 4Fe-4S binding protein, partial [Anaerolineales bacterium]|nr:4Fe-4S binding protein [Anaerolineales bacterium]